MTKITYDKTNWINNQTKLNADNMNHIESGISAVTDAVNAVDGAYIPINTSQDNVVPVCNGGG